MRLTWQQALAWRLDRHLLDPVGTGSVSDVVGRLGAVPAWPDASTELAVGARRMHARTGDVARALEAGEVVKTYLFRGATHLVTPRDGGAYLALRAAGRQWELPSWQEAYGLAPADWPAFRDAVRVAVDKGPLTRQELAAALRSPRYRLAAEGFFSSSDTFLKALMWQGDLCFGPTRDGVATVQRADGVPGWGGIPDLDDAGRFAVEQYLRTYAPVTGGLEYWFGEALSAGRKRIQRWLGDLGDRVVTVDVGGDECLVHVEDAESLATASPSGAVRLLPAQDQWVMGPGTKDPQVVPPAQRSHASRGANLVVVGGVVSGTWTLKADRLVVTPFEDVGPLDPETVQAEVARLGSFLGRPVQPA